MARVLAGMLLGSLAAAALGLGWTRWDPCLARCGPETRCSDHHCVAAPAPKLSTPPVERRRPRPRGELPPAAAEERLHPGDEQPLAQGDALGRPEHIDLSEAGGPGELADQELEQGLRAAEPAIVRCISDAVGNAPLESGQVEVGLRVERTGAVSRVRVVGPALLQRRGLTRCIRPIVSALRFPASGGASVATYPFALK